MEVAASETTGNMLHYAADFVAHLWQVHQVKESHCTVCFLYLTPYKLSVEWNLDFIYHESVVCDSTYILVLPKLSFVH